MFAVRPLLAVAHFVSLAHSLLRPELLRFYQSTATLAVIAISPAAPSTASPSESTRGTTAPALEGAQTAGPLVVWRAPAGNGLTPQARPPSTLLFPPLHVSPPHSRVT